MRALLGILFFLSAASEAATGAIESPSTSGIPRLHSCGPARGPPSGESLLPEDVESLPADRRRSPIRDPGTLGLIEPAQDHAGAAGSESLEGSLPRTIGGPEPPPPRSRLQLELLELSLPPDLVQRFDSVPGADPFGDVGDALMRGPETILDSVLRLVAGLYPRSNPYAIGGESSGGITQRIFEFESGPREGRIFSEFVSSWVDREQHSFARYADAGYAESGEGEGAEEPDPRALLREQGKVLWDTLRLTYLSKYKYRGEERLRDDAFYFGEWRTADYFVLPPLVAGYVWWRGLEKRASWGATWLQISVEPLSSWITGSEDIVACVSAEWGIRGFPVGLIISAGVYDGEGEADFVGIGTSIGLVRQALGVRFGE